MTQPSHSVASEAELSATIRRMESRLSASPVPQVSALYRLYAQLLPKFEQDLGSSPRDVALAKASALMLVQAAEQAANAA